MISLNQVTIIRDGRTVINDLSATIDSGTITALVGPNGSGKTSLILALAGEISIASGSISLAGQPLDGISRGDLAMLRSVVLAQHSYWLAFTVGQIITMGLSHDQLTEVDLILTELEIKDFVNQSITSLSSGQLQRVEIARALARDCEIILLDEPLSAQDNQSRVRIISLLQRLRNQGRTIVLVAHLQESDLTWCDQIIDQFSN